MSTKVHADPVSGAPFRFINGALDASGRVPRLLVVPEISGTPTPFAEYGDGAIELLGIAFTINAGQAIMAGSRLLNGRPDAHFVGPGGRPARRTTTTPIVRVDVVAVGVDTGTPAAGVPIGRPGVLAGGSGTAATEAQTRTCMRTYTFDESDDVRELILFVSDRYTSAAAEAAANGFVMLEMGGLSYA